MRPALAVATILLLISAGAHAEGDGANPPRLIVTVDGENIQYRLDRAAAEAAGGVRILVELAGQPERRAIIHAEKAGALLESGEIVAESGVTIGTRFGVLAGEQLTLNAQTDEFRLQQAQAGVNLAPDQPQSLLGYIFGEEIGSTHEVVYILRGRITTSDRRNPEYTLQAKHIEYYPSRRRFKVKGAAIKLYGVRLPLIPNFSFKIGMGEDAGLIPTPGYSSTDRFFVPYRFDFSGPDAPLQSHLTLRLTQKRGLRLQSDNTYLGNHWLAEGLVSQTEDYYDGLDRHIVLDRRPELRYTRFSASPQQDTGWAGSLTLANIVEDLQTASNSPDARPNVREQSAELSLRYDWHNNQRRAGQGEWYSVGGRQAFYSTGDSYRDIALTAGVGGQISTSLSGSLALTHHIFGGQTPFLYDAVSIRTELQPTGRLQMGPKWSLHANGRYDLGEANMHDYGVELRHHDHALTWGLRYRSASSNLGLAVYVTGLTGDTPPYEQKHPLNELYHQTQQELAAGKPEP